MMDPPAECDVSLRSQTADFLIVIECLAIFRIRRQNHQRVLRLIPQPEIGIQRQTIRKIKHMRNEMPFPVFMRECKIHLLIPPEHIAGSGISRKMRSAHRHGIHLGFRHFFRDAEVQQAHAAEAHIGIIVNRQGQAEFMIRDEIVIPFLDAQRTGLDALAIIGLDQASCPAPLNQLAMRIKQLTMFCEFVFHVHSLLFLLS